MSTVEQSVEPTVESMAPELGSDVVRELLHRMRELPTLGERYRHLDKVSKPALTDLPVLTKDDFRTAFPDVLARARRRGHGALVLGSGGTTSKPKLSLVPSEQMIDDIRAQWNPLAEPDILVNYDTPGRLCSSHNFFNALANASGAVSIPLGAVEDKELPEWLDFIEQLGATAINATQSQLAHLLESAARMGRTPSAVRKVLWTGEPFGEHALGVVREVLPAAELFGVYGSTETWVIGHNGPHCDIDTFHVLPYQHVELVDGLILISNLHPTCLNPVVRYRIGDRGRFTECPCGTPGQALKVLGRDDPQVKFLSILCTPQEIADAARSVPGVSEVQVALFEHGSHDEHMELRLRLRSDTDRETIERAVRDNVLRRVYRLGYEVAAKPDAFSVRAVERFSTNPRSGKTPLLVLHDSSA